MPVLFYSLYDIIHEKDKSNPLFFHEHLDSDPDLEDEFRDVVKFADNALIEAKDLTKVRNYYFESERTEVISIIINTLNSYLIQGSLSIDETKSSLQTISERYSRIEKGVIESKSSINKPAPSNIFYVLSEESSEDDETNNYLFFIAKIEKNEFLDSDVLKILKGLPYREAGKKSDKSWKTVSISFSVQFNEDNNPIPEIDNVVISDTSSSIASYWAEDFLETTEVTDDEKNTLDSYNEVRRTINNLNREKDKTPGRKSDINHFINQLNGYFLGNDTFDFEKMVEHVFGSAYIPVCQNLDMGKFQEKVIKLKDSDKFDNNFSIIQKVVENKAKQTYKVSDKIDIRINKHINNISDTITSETDELGKPYIKIKVDNTENDAYIRFKKNGSDENELG